MIALPLPEKTLSPSWRCNRVRLAAMSGSVGPDMGPEEVDFYNFITGESAHSDSVSAAYTLYTLPSCRAVLCSMLLADAPVHYIAEAVEDTEETVMAFSRLFFDCSVFRNRLLKLAYVRQLPTSSRDDVLYKELCSWAMSLGPDYITWKMSLKQVASILDSEKSLEAIAEDAYWRSREHRMFAPDSNNTSQARAWIPTVIKSIEDKRKRALAQADDTKEIRIKLIQKSETTSLEDADCEIVG
tara:strand:+ start:343 stop:1068 length:726 start_codon:yes stop_codon:yes gene_type:complete